MDVTDVMTRANKIEAAICERLDMTSEAYMMLFFESGCQMAERFVKEIDQAESQMPERLDKDTARNVHGLTDKQLMGSNVFWYWWAKNFMQSCEIVLRTRYKELRVLNRLLETSPWPSVTTYGKIAMELNFKNKAQCKASLTK